jgi:hypothetical protein
VEIGLIDCKMQLGGGEVDHKDFVNLIGQEFIRNHGHGKSGGKSSCQKKGKGKKPCDPPPPPQRKKVVKKSPQIRVLSATTIMIGDT